jgi:response regulator RpfG family c-di-GMP phosphodiesterase/signal transduction histidine kinase
VKSGEIKKQIKRFIINVGTSGKYTGQREFGMSDYLIRYVLLNFICILGTIILLGFLFARLSQGKHDTVVACAVMILICFVTIALSRAKKVSQIVPAMILMVFYALLCITVTWLGEAAGSNFLFVYLYPPLTIMMLGMRFGIILSLLLPAIVSLEMFVPGLSRYSYPATVPIHMLVTYFLVFSVMVVVETTRKTKDRLIKTQNKKLQELTEEAQSANRTKSSFLASMSHEIRTPMNAITGMAELLMRGKLSDEARGYVQDIKQAGANLISIINDILDFSKIEAGKLEIVPIKYLLASLVNDSISIIRMRLMEKPIRFYTNIDGRIPNGLVGDEARLRQIFLNLLSNAIKYTVKGNISISITQEKREGSQVWLKIEVADTGLGIKPEDQAKLFADFVQVDTKKNRGIEGTGLGLAITKRLCIAMGGDITVKSEYGKGSSFIVVIPQGVYNEAPFAVVEEPEKKKVLVYEGRVCYARSVGWSLENMKVPHVIVTDQAAFAEALFQDEWFFVFSGYGLYEKISPLMASFGKDSRGKQPPLALMVEWGTESYIPGVRFVSLPVQSLSIANILNGKADNKGYFDHSVGLNTIRFTLPHAKILVVDDISTNLKVAEGLLAPYKTAVETSLGGAEAIELVKHKNYDLVFMDHMMPDVDGIEATAEIRLWEASLKEQGITRNAIPIIALTANAVSGMREMFIEKGFNDFLAKPIDISKLDEILDRWIPKEKRAMSNAENSDVTPNSEAAMLPLRTLNPIPGVDMAKGITMTGGKEGFYRRVLELYIKDALERLPRLQTVPEKDALKTFITQVHSLKSASASIGAAELSAEAAALEAAGKSENLAYIKDNLSGFTKHLTELVENIRAALTPAQSPGVEAEKNMENEKPLIILVDDNPANLRIGKNVLSEKFAVATAPSAEKLFGLLENNNPTMILLDVDMPEINGYDAIKVLKSKPQTHDVPVIFVTGRTESDDELAGLSLGAIDYITKPFQPSLLLKRIEVHLLVEDQKKKLEKQAAELQYFNDNLQKMVDEKTASVINMQNALLKTMAELVECRDDITGGHIERTQKGIKILLDGIEKNGLYNDETKNWNVELLLQSSQLHDVGKISIDDSILKKPGKLTDEEFAAMKEHAAFGKKIIEKIETLAKENDFLDYAKIFAASHHEKWDGTGYPNGLKGKDIPLLGRIMAIADVYDALTSVRPYKKAFPHEEAVRIIAEGSGKQFDPALVEIFLQTADQFRDIINSQAAP